MADYARSRGLAWPGEDVAADAEFVHFVETQLAGAIGVVVGADHDRLGGQGGSADTRRGRCDPRRGLAGDGLQPPARAEVARAGGRHCRAARRQRAPQGTRPAQGRLHLDGDARTAHAAHLDPRLLGDPARRPGRRAGRADEVPRHHHPRDRAADAPDQPGPRHGQDLLGPCRMADDRGRRSRRGGRHAGTDEPGLQGKGRAARREPAANRRRPCTPTSTA